MTLALDRPVRTAAVDDSSPATTIRAARPARAVTAGDDIDELIRTHLPLVGHLVREMLARVPVQVRRDELTSAALLALTASARSFDSSKGAPFAAYATLRIRGAITDELRSMDWASRSVRSKAREVESVRATLTQTLGRTPSSAEVAQSMAVSLRELSAIASDVDRASVVSLSTLTREDSDDLLPTQQDGPESMLLRREQLGYLRDAIAELPERLRAVVDEYFFAQRRMADIAADLGVTESRVSQMRSEGLALLRAALQAADGDTHSAQPANGGGRRQATLDKFAAAVTTRSTLAGRLTATSPLADYRG